MNLHTINSNPAPRLAAALAEFETQFTYPLGPGKSFRIDHGQDYPRFYRAMGDNACFVAERNGKVLGVLSAALRTLNLPFGDQRTVVYVGDLKVAPGKPGGRTVLRLILRLRRWARQRAVAAYSIVMDGTQVTPVRYTGRLGIEPFVELGKLVILSIPTHIGGKPKSNSWRNDELPARKCYQNLSQHSARCLESNPGIRSFMKPYWLVHPESHAAGLLEDTRQAKRLIGMNGKEMIRSHLSFCAWSNHASALALLREALRSSADRGFDEMFVAVSPQEANSLVADLGVAGVTLAPATIYGYGLDAGMDWSVNTSEI
ncbi:MAG: N-acetyltransferase [Gammaproteobacteria bacterium]|nr:N-acetyltransferase [Gammaproteobacteria bacterium]